MSKSSEWIREVTPDMLETPYSQFAEIIGVENLFKLAIHLGGTGFYMAKPDKIFKTIRDKRIKQEFDGRNFVELARKYHLSEKTIRNIIGQSIVLKGF